MQFSKFSFEEFYNQHKMMVYNVALNYVQNVEEAEEIMQDVFVKAHQSYHTFKSNSNIKTWLYRIAINASLDFIKHKSSQKRVFIYGKKSSNEFEILNLSTFDHPGIALENKENATILFRAINSLVENQKTAFMLSKLEELSNPEISVIMDLSVSAVESLVFRAKQSLRELLSKEFENYRKKK